MSVNLSALQPVLWRAAALWLPTAVAVTGVAALAYGAVQQDLRQSANDPQVQMAEDVAAELDAGASPTALLSSTPVNLARSLAPYVMVFDATGNLMASSVQLHGAQPPFPTSVFNDARNGRDSITWQPESGVRSAVVVEPWRGGFVVAGRSLRLVEEREERVMLLSAFMWLMTLGATAVAALLAGGILAARRGELPWRRLSGSRAVSRATGFTSREDARDPSLETG